MFIDIYNGGKPTPRRYITKDGITESSVMMFLPLADIDSSNLRRNYLIFNKANLIPANLLPIAEAPRMHQICISLYGEDARSVYHWFADHEDEEIIPSYEYMYLIADSFTEFINCLFDPNKRNI
ncbi:SMI1/KNR4 family protein [Acetivibrio clariflavus]|uniref:SMI1/KNR4 family protein n=1 Tax=Acetivibrio clariflavus TaxID=288965 RepID=UPI0009DF0E9F